MALKENIKKARLNLNLTLDDVAKVVGVSRQTIQRYESGVIGNIPSDRIEKLAIALHTSPEALMGWDKNNEVALRISTLMAQHGASPDEWAALDKVGITPTLIQDYMDGTKIPTQKEVQCIANIFHVSQSWLATGKGSADDTDTLQDKIPVLDDPQIRLLARNSQLSKQPEKQKLLKKLIQSVLEDDEE